MAAKKKPERTALQEQNVITRDLISAMITKDVLGLLKKPSDDALDKLAQRLEIWRKEYIASQKFDLLKRQVHARVNALKTTLIKLRKEYITVTLRSSEIGDKIDVIDMALKAIDSLYRESIAVEGASELSWMWLANAMPADIIEAIGSTNPGRRVGISQGGPLSRFVAAVVPYVTGEHPTAESIATQLKIHRKRSRDR